MLHHVVVALLAMALEKQECTNCVIVAIGRLRLTLMGAGGGLNQDIRREIGCHFSQEPPRDLKILDFFKNDVGPRLKESF